MYGVPMEDVTRDQRSDAKRINFGLMYGRGARSLSAQLGTDEERGRQLIDEYFANYPKVQRFLQRTANRAMRDRTLRTLAGRVRKFGNDPVADDRGAMRREAMNYPIQGVASRHRQAGPRLRPRGSRRPRRPAHKLHPRRVRHRVRRGSGGGGLREDAGGDGPGRGRYPGEGARRGRGDDLARVEKVSSGLQVSAFFGWQSEIRRASPGDAEVLTRIAFAAKRYWGYPERWIEHWSESLTVTPEFVERQRGLRGGLGRRTVRLLRPHGYWP